MPPAANVNPLDFIKYLKYIPAITQIVASVQALRGPGNGAEKKAEALKLAAAAIAIAEGISEKDFVNDAEGLALADEMIELGVALMKLQPRVEAIAARIRALKPKVA